MKHSKTLLILLFSVLLFSCSSDKSNNASAKATVDPDLTGERFFDSAASLMMRNMPNLTRTQANCMVTNMTKDGRYGLGEINQMDLSPANLENNSANLLKAYKTALSACN